MFTFATSGFVCGSTVCYLSGRRIPLDVGKTADEQEGYALDVSEYLFRLTTKCLRHYSNETCAYQTLASLISARLLDPRGVERQDLAAIREHFATIPTGGKVRIHLKLSDVGARSLEDVRQTLSNRLNADLTVGDALSVLLFDYIVELNVAQAMDRLERDDLLSTTGGAAITHH